MFDVKTDFVPEVIADSIPQTLSDIGDVIDTIPDAIADGVTTTVSRTRRLLRQAPWTSDPGMTRRRWLVFAGVVGLISAFVAIWVTRRSDRSDDETAPSATGADPTVASHTRRVA